MRGPPRADVLVRGWNKHVRVSVARNTLTARAAMQRHVLPLKDAMPLGKLLASASLLASILRGDERVIMDMQHTKGPRFYAEAIAVGEARGFVRREPDDDDDESPARVTAGLETSPLLDMPDPDTLSVKLILYEQAKPIESIVPVVGEGNVEGAMRSYFERSEQIASVVKFEAEAADDEIVFCGGLLASALPSADTRTLMSSFEKRLEELLPLRKHLDVDPDVDPLADKKIEGFLGK